MTQAAEHIVRSAFPDVLQRLTSEAYAQGYADAKEQAAKVISDEADRLEHVGYCDEPGLLRCSAAAIRAMTSEDEK